MLVGGLIGGDRDDARLAGRRTEQQYWLGPNYMATLPPPALRVATPQPVDSFIDGMARLEAPLLKQAEKRNDQTGGSGDNEE